jgi:hypothetical protein
MSKDSIETLLSRHYGNTAPVPGALEAQLLASVRQEARALREQELVAENLRQRRMSRRRAVQLVAIGTAGAGVVSLGLEGLRLLEGALAGQDVTQPAYP